MQRNTMSQGHVTTAVVKKNSITHSECASVTLVIQQAIRMRRIIQGKHKNNP
jgi:hypothetical protein